MMMKKFLPRMACALLATAAFALPASANGVYQGYISQLSVDNSGRYGVTIQFTGPIPPGAPVCANGSVTGANGSGNANMFVMDAASTVGKLQIDLLRDAITTQKLVRVIGASTCTKAPGFEDIYVVIRYPL